MNQLISPFPPSSLIHRRNMQVGENILREVQAAPTSIPVLFITFIMTHILWLQTDMLKYASEGPTNVTQFLVSVLKYR